MFLAEKSQNIDLTHGRGELCSPAGDRRSLLRIKMIHSKQIINPDRFFENLSGFVFYLVCKISIFPSTNPTPTPSFDFSKSAYLPFSKYWFNSLTIYSKASSHSHSIPQLYKRSRDPKSVNSSHVQSSSSGSKRSVPTNSIAQLPSDSS